ncbi:MAG: hypothetical protein ACFCD0_00820 [Gemmataceae bacterium]
MFTTEDLKNRVCQRPFRPFRVVTSTDQHYDVYHPDLVMVGRREMVIGYPSGDDPTSFEGLTRVAILHITEMQDLATPATPPENNDAN